MDTGQF